MNSKQPTCYVIAGPNGAGKTLLREIRGHVADGEDFAFETTLSGKSYVRLLKELRAKGGRNVLFYLWIPSAEFSAARVRKRVESGGHDIPADAIARRYPRTVGNFMHVFASLCDQVVCYDNSDMEPTDVFVEGNGSRTILDDQRYAFIMEGCSEG